jgi:hypothetical protein
MTKEKQMSDDANESSPLDPQEALRLLDDARSRLRTAIWALHGMHQDMNALAVDDLADITFSRRSSTTLSLLVSRPSARCWVPALAGP